MPDPTLLNDLGLQMVDSLPPGLRNSYDYLAVINSISKEFENLEAQLELLRLEMNPATSTLLLPAWEYTFKLPVGGNGASVPQRQQAVVARYRKLLGQAEGRQWVASITDLVGQNWSYEEHIPGDGTSPPDGTLKITLPFALDSSRWLDAVNQISEMTTASLELSFVSAAAFQLDVSPMDETPFGA